MSLTNAQLDKVADVMERLADRLQYEGWLMYRRTRSTDPIKVQKMTREWAAKVDKILSEHIKEL